MSRDGFDIPEVFRKAMEEAGWNNSGDGGGDGGDGRRPFPQRPTPSPRSNRLRWVIGVIVLILFSLSWIITTYTDWLWFLELDYEDVWLRQWLFRILSFVIFFLIGPLFMLLNWHLARRRAIRESSEIQPKILQTKAIGWIITGIALFLCFGFASSIAANWELFLRYIYQVPFGTADPIFGLDISFYLFNLPVFEMLQQWLLSLFILTLIGTIIIYAINNIIDIQKGQWRPHLSAKLRQHVALLAAFILGLWAVGYIFSVYGLLFSARGVVFGAGYTDLNASLYALYAQLVVMALIALAALFNIFRLNLRLIGAAAGLWLLVTLVGGGIIPGLVQQYSVVPDELARETPYIAHNIKYTRMAFGLNDVETRPFTNIVELDQQTLNENDAILQNVRLWDYRPLQTTYEKLQALRLYYQFSDVDIDRYVIDGQPRQVMLAARELNKGNLENQAWVNTKLQYTHGYGIVMNPVDKVTSSGQPDFFIKDLPPQSNIDLEVERPEIYYGEQTTDVVFVNTDETEFNYPLNEEVEIQSEYTYDGDGGVLLDNGLKELAFAIRLGDTNLLISPKITRNTRVQIHREIKERILEITPFLELDSDPYIVVWNGRLVWIQDAYTTSSRFPYSEPFGQINYIRNSVKITVDAYDGTVTYYLTDSGDPIIQTYANAFPSLFKPLSQMPEGLQSHLRYPEDLFRVQTEHYATYHMTDVRTFFLKEDKWEIPQEQFQNGQQPIEPYYVMLNLPGEEELEYLLILPMTPTGKENMVTWIAARNDGEHYGELVVYLLSRQELVNGPIQVEARIDQNPEISGQFTLWGQSGSSVIRGNLLTIPMGNSFLYVEPIYLQATGNALPELKRVIVATSDRIAMRETLDEALAALLLDDAIVVETAAEPDATSDATIDPTPAPAEVDAVELGNATVEELIQSANVHFQAAEAAQRDGDWTTYGEELEALERDLAQLSLLIDE